MQQQVSPTTFPVLTEQGSYLARFTINLTDLARQGRLDPVIGRDEEIRRVIQILSRRTKNNPVLIGEPGTGKTAIVEGLAQRMIAGDVPDSLKNKELVQLEIGGLIAGAAFRGQFEERIRGILRELKDDPDQYVMFIDELHTMVGAGRAEGAIDAANLLKPALARGELRAIGATTIKEYQLYIEKDAALERRFQTVLIGEPSNEDAVAILRGIKEKYEIHHGIKITDEALVASVRLSSRYISDRFLPDKAIDLIDEAAAALRIAIDSVPPELDRLKRRLIRLEVEKQAALKDKQATDRLAAIEQEINEVKQQLHDLESQWLKEKELLTKIRELTIEVDRTRQNREQFERVGNLERVAELQYDRLPNLEQELQKTRTALRQLQGKKPLINQEVTDEDVARVVAKWTGVPVERLIETEANKLSRLEETLRQRVIGQDQALAALANAIRRSRAGLAEANRPIGSFIFMGPTGVGKTETVKALAQVLFDDEKAMIRLDMSEYMEGHTVARMIGAPPGYVGYEEGGQLTEKVRRRPYSIILLDEIEKAHPQIFNILLQILDDGQLTDGRGRTVSFRNTVTIMTSNLGTDQLAKHKIGFSTVRQTEQKSRLREDIRHRLKETLKDFFKPEFLNRVDEVIIFEPLTPTELERIVDLQLELVKRRLAEQAISVEFEMSVKRHLVTAGFDPQFGARPLKRAIEQTILNTIAKEMIAQKVKPGDRISVSIKNDQTVISIH